MKPVQGLQMVRELAVLYELSLAVGRTLGLEDNCERFLQVLLRRKSFRYGAVWLNDVEQERARLIYGYPSYYVENVLGVLPAAAKACIDNDEGLVITAQMPGFDELVQERQIDGGCYFLYPLGKMGVLKLYSVQEELAENKVLQRMLAQVMQKFAVSVEACLLFERLREEATERRQAEDEVRSLNSQLEQRVAKRTEQLLEANAKLRQEIIERKRVEEQLRIYSEKDALTGLANRSRFERLRQELAEMPQGTLGVLAIDVNDLKLVNDLEGHEAGDELLRRVSSVLQSVFGEAELLARIGGDEFVALYCDEPEELMQQKAKLLAQEAEAARVSLSVGWAWGDLLQITSQSLLQAADSAMYAEKYKFSSRYEQGGLARLRRMLEVGSRWTGPHVQRLEGILVRFGRYLELPDSEESLRLLAMFHDVGTLLLPEVLVNKDDVYTPEERALMESHAEKGAQLARMMPELASLANLILHHHERWDGAGYPAKLQGEETPYLSRVLAVADAYESMTGTRVHRKSLTQEQALAELERCAGSQFDADVVYAFREMLSFDEG
nr:HD domain-containing phosphohydrolase [uncultured Anaeromusa sp.]